MNGMTNIIEIINSKTAEKEKEIIAEAESYKKQKLQEARAKAKEVTASITGKAEIESNAEVSRYEASAKLKSKYQLLDAKEVLIEDVLSSARKHLEDLVKKKAYDKTLEKLIVDATVSLEETELEIAVPKGHASNIDLNTVEAAVTKATSKKRKLSISKEDVRATGGVIVRNKDSTMWVDNTFEARLERYESEIRDTISSILFSAEEKKE
ncbi:MAG: V-type ATP synthase subunit E [Candidatus Thorarchaeota archaeon]|jgi:V/A-type H+-transporting ATPase subunit E